jgi:glutathione-regulated potassium-efflux system ancillary protein KefG
MNRKNKILILFAHPAFHKSRVNKILISKIKNLEGITLHDLYEEYPDFHIDVNREQKLLLKHDIVVWHHPFYWYSSPPILKEWIDLVLEHGFAYGKTGTSLEGKKIFSAISSGGKKEVYAQGGTSLYSLRELLSPFELTARLCNMDYLPPFAVHGTHLMNSDGILSHAEDYKSILVALRDDLFEQSDLNKPEYLNDILKLNKNH